MIPTGNAPAQSENNAATDDAFRIGGAIVGGIAIGCAIGGFFSTWVLGVLAAAGGIAAGTLVAIQVTRSAKG